MSIIIRLQNLAWAASSVDIRRYFTGLSIPEGGVHIVGGEKGDAFIAFSTDEDARLAMEKDGGKIKEMKIKLLLSSRTEMLRVIEQARQQNLAVQPADSDRRKPAPGIRVDRSPSPRPRRTSPPRDKRRSSKRERSRSRSRSPNRRNRDVDRRNSSDRFRRDDRRSDDGPQRYNRDDRQNKRDHDRKNDNSNYFDRTQKNFPYAGETKTSESDPVFDAPQGIPVPFQEKREDTALAPSSVGYQRGGVPSKFNQEKDHFDKRQPHEEPLSQGKPRRKSRFEPEFPTPVANQFVTDGKNASVRDRNAETNPNVSSAGGYKPTHLSEPPVPFGAREDINRPPWPRKTENGDWEEKRSGLLDRPVLSATKNKDFIQVVPMDIDDGQNSPEHIVQPEYRFPPGNAAHPNRDRQHGSLPFGRNEVHESNLMLMGNKEPIAEHRKPSKFPERPTNFMVQVKGLHPNAPKSDVLQLFRGIPLPPEYVSMEVKKDGLTAFVHFLNQCDLEEAMSRDMQFVGQSRLQVSRFVPYNSMNAHIPHFSTNPPLRTKELCIQLKGLPLTCNEDTIAHFLNGLNILHIFIERGPDGRASGIGFAELGNLDDFHASMSMNGKMLGHHPINITAISKEAMSAAKRENLKRQERFKHEHRGPNMQNISQQNRPPMHPDELPMCVVLRGLPENVMNRDIADFFSVVNVVPRAIHIMLKNKVPSGDAFAELGDPRDVDIALQQNGKFLLGVRVSVTPITFQEMTEIMGRPPPNSHEPGMVPKLPVNLAPHHLEHGPEHLEYELHDPEYLEYTDLEDGPPHMKGRGPPALLKTPGDLNRPRRPLLGHGEHDPQPPHGRALLERFPPPRGGRPPFNRMRGAPPRGASRPMGPFGDGPPRGPRFPPRNPGHHNSEHAPRDFGPPRYRTRNMGPPSPERGPKDFGAPGCVVGINNLHFRAGLEELLDFFDGYMLSKDSIIRKYNENGQTTGEARVAFQNPRDAERALRELNNRPIMGRPLSLCII